MSKYLKYFKYLLIKGKEVIRLPLYLLQEVVIIKDIIELIENN
jgi:hypothetical protein